jgi:hypothetical protein
MECVASVLDVQANGVDHAIGARNGGLYGALVVCVGGDLFDLVAPPGCREATRRGAGLAQIAHDATANKATRLRRSATLARDRTANPVEQRASARSRQHARPNIVGQALAPQCHRLM